MRAFSGRTPGAEAAVEQGDGASVGLGRQLRECGGGEPAETGNPHRTAGRVLRRDSPAIDRDHPARRRSDFESGHGPCFGRTSYRAAAAVHAARGQLGSSRCRDQCAGWTGVRAASTGHLRESRGQARPFPIGEAGRRAERFCRWDLPPVLEGCGRGGRHDVSRSRRRGSTASVSAYVSRRYTRLCDYAL